MSTAPAPAAVSAPSSTLVKELVEAGIHYGHRSTHWNPKMAPYIFGKRNKIHILDVKATVKGILLARKFLSRVAAEGKDVLFVGTKRQASGIVEAHAKACGMPYVADRWLGGTLTNFTTIRKRLHRLDELETLDSSGEINNYSKKMESTLHREKNKITRNLGGIRNMGKMPGAMFIVDIGYEATAAREAKKMGIPVVALVDTDANPDLVDLPIPGNDDAIRAIEVIVAQIAEAVAEGKKSRPEKPVASEKSESRGEGSSEKGAPEKRDGRGGPAGQRRSRRSQFSAGEGRAE